METGKQGIEGLLQIDENGMVNSRRLHEVLGVRRDYSEWIKLRLKRLCLIEGEHFRVIFKGDARFTQEEVKSMSSRQRSRYGISTDYIVTLDVAKLICQKRRTNKNSTEVLKYLLSIDQKEVIVVEQQRMEIEFLDVLEKQLRVFGITKFERQSTRVKSKRGNYKIDLYLPEINVAIEYDEERHKYYGSEAQELRQELIERELGCRFIRVCDDKDHVTNSAIVIRELILHNLLNN